MNDDYLWDRSGTPDADVERLERTLAPLAHAHRAKDPAWRLPEVTAAAAHSTTGRSWKRYALPLALAASLGALIIGPLVHSSVSGPTWTIEPVAGTPRTAAGVLRTTRAFAAGDWLETDEKSAVRLGAGLVGEIDIGARSRVRLVSTQPGHHRIELSRGTLQAYVWSAPGEFLVDTPSATAIDLGCAYTLEVSRDGQATLEVTAGWVAVEAGGLVSLVPAGARCHTRRAHGPGTPSFVDAPPALTAAINIFDDPATSAAGLDAALRAVLDSARAKDAVTLWHLLTRVNGKQADVVFDRLALLAAPPPGLDRHLVLAGDRAALDAWWDTLGLGSASLFRTRMVRPTGR